MFTSMSRSVFKVFVILVVIAIIALGGMIPAHAGTGTISYNPAHNFLGATCGSTWVGFDITVKGTTNDGLNRDDFAAVAIDGYGNYLPAKHIFT